MKQAYVSVVLIERHEIPLSVLVSLDEALSLMARAHEIVVVSNLGRDRSALHPLHGPITFISVFSSASLESMISAGLSRAVGDFVVEWRGDAASLTDGSLLRSALRLTDESYEVVYIEHGASGMVGRVTLAVANRARGNRPPVVVSAGTLYSRRALGALLAHEPFFSSLLVLTSELPYRSFWLRGDIDSGIASARVGMSLQEGLSLLARATNLGKTLPLAVAGLFAMLALVASVWALAVYLFSDQTPQGWTTLMVLLGIGQASVLVMLGLLWSQASSLRAAIAGRIDIVATIEVEPPVYRGDPSAPRGERPRGQA